MANTYQVGDLVRITGTWTDSSDVAVDPTTVLAQHKDPSGNVTALVVGAGQIIKSSTGIYYFDIDADEDGTWLYRFYGQSGTSTGLGANEDHFVAVTNF